MTHSSGDTENKTTASEQRYESLPPFDHTTPEYRDNLEQTIEYYRSRCPVGHSAKHRGFWYALEPETVRHIANNPATFVSSRGLSTPPTPVPNTMIPINQDPPDLYEWRRILNPKLTPRLMEAKTARIREKAFELFDAAVAKGSVDIVNDVAQPLSGMTTLDLLGLDPATWDEYAIPFHHLAFGLKEHDEIAPEMREMEDRLRRDIKERLGTPDCAGLIKYLSEEATFNGRKITFDEIYNICLIFVGGGLDTTQALIGSATVFLGENPDRQQEIIDHPERMPGAIEEFLRSWPPTQNLSREAVRDAKLRGNRVHANERVLMSIVGANHDPKEFPNPYQVDFTREPNRHFTFGVGPHRCLGSHLARIMISATLTALLTRAPGFRVDRSKLKLARDISVFYGYQGVPLILP